MKMSFQWPKAQVCSVTCCPHSKRLKKKKKEMGIVLICLCLQLQEIFFSVGPKGKSVYILAKMPQLSGLKTIYNLCVPVTFFSGNLGLLSLGV